MTDYTSVDLSFLLAEEESLSLPRFDVAAALSLGQRLLAMAVEEGLSVTLAVWHGEQLVFHAALPGTVPDQADWIRRKRATVYRFGHSSYYVGRTYTDQGIRFEDVAHLDGSAYAAHGGGVPVTVQGTGLVGVALVSGLRQDLDHDLAVRALTAHLASGS